MHRLWRLLPLFGIVAGLSGCAVTVTGGSEGRITVPNAFKTIQAGSAPVTLNALGNAGQPIAVTWSLTYVGQSCSPDCGTLGSITHSSVVYTPPTNAPAYGQATITVKSGSDVWVDDIEITPAISVSIAPKFSMQFAGGPQVILTATVSYDTASAGVTWSLTAGGSNCAPACGMLTPGAGGPSFTATYQPPAVVPSGANSSPTITAASVTATSKSDSFSFTINPNSTLLQGSYTLLLRGYYLTGSPMAIAGSVTADGKGNITNGEFDVDNGGGITHIQSPVTGTYSIDLSFNRSTRGRIVITSFHFPGSNNGIAFDFVLSADGKRGRAVEADGSAFINSGTILLQDASALSAGKVSGTYAFGLDSDAPVGGRLVEAGQFVLAAAGITGGILDRSRAGHDYPIYSAAQMSPGTATPPDSSGRGTLTIAVPAQGTTPAESVLYAYYVVNSGQLNLIEIDDGKATGVQAGVAYVQKAPSQADTTSVLQLTGMDAIPAASCAAQQQPNCIAPDVIIGALNISGTAFAMTFDENDMGKVLRKHHAQGTVSYDPSTGRGAFADPGGFQNGFMDSAVFYMYDAGKALVIDADISTCVDSTNPCSPSLPPSGLPITNTAFSGTFVPQASGPFSDSSLSGDLIGGSGASAIPDVPDIAAIVSADASSGSFNILADLDSANPQTGNLQNYAFVGTYSVSSQAPDPALGYGTANLPAFVFDSFVAGPASASFYLIGPNQAVMVGTQQGTYSGITLLDPP